MTIYKKHGKRFLDVAIASIGLLMLFPLMVALALLVHRRLGGPIIFVQTRPGLQAKPFKMFKFRSMTNDTDEEGRLLPNAQRMTRFGMFLRATSLDELPELWNVVKGEMSLVGPRPLLMDYLPYYDEKQNLRNEIKPGITGWTQVMGRNTLDWETKFKFDIWYVENFGFLLDLKIFALTIWKVFKREGIVHEGATTMPRFDEYILKKNRI